MHSSARTQQLLCLDGSSEPPLGGTDRVPSGTRASSLSWWCVLVVPLSFVLVVPLSFRGEREHRRSPGSVLGRLKLGSFGASCGRVWRRQLGEGSAGPACRCALRRHGDAHLFAGRHAVRASP